jgi:hypothetical protein
VVINEGGTKVHVRNRKSFHSAQVLSWHWMDSRQSHAVQRVSSHSLSAHPKSTAQRVNMVWGSPH